MTLLVKKPRKRKPLTLFDLKNPHAIVEVRNSKTDKSTIPSDTCIDYYFKRVWHTPPFTSMEDDRTMVGAHVELANIPHHRYILPLCKNCCSKKHALRSFEVYYDLLCPLPKRQ